MSEKIQIQRAIDNVITELHTLYNGQKANLLIENEALTVKQSFNIMINRFSESLRNIGIPQSVIDKIENSLSDSEKNIKRWMENSTIDSLEEKRIELKHHLEQVFDNVTEKKGEINLKHEENSLSHQLDSFKLSLGKSESKTEDEFSHTSSEILSILDRNGIQYNEDFRYAVRKMCKESAEILLESVNQQLSTADSRMNSSVLEQFTQELSKAVEKENEDDKEEKEKAEEPTPYRGIHTMELSKDRDPFA